MNPNERTTTNPAIAAAADAAGEVVGMVEAQRVKPCPLCGGAMRVRTNRDWHRLVGEHTQDCLMQDFEPYYAATPKDRDALVTAWNRRSMQKVATVFHGEVVMNVDADRLPHGTVFYAAGVAPCDGGKQG